MYSINFHISSFGLHTALKPPTVEATQAGISSSDKDFHGPGHPNSQNDRFLSRKKEDIPCS
ncbi:Hypothetical protein FKW44_014727 [Caligus rogercresseyi]|uniref:Uncharacterized protein n=1 Tax=Caligus rogercresseyi TaxID=217165 RepID=A0A7T8JZ58_CALRO|nr:Hypothetical protein FKW44_014727 [Caligus rogercresseyi]